MIATYMESGAAKALWRILTWPARVSEARRTMSHLARMSEFELRDIGSRGPTSTTRRRCRWTPIRRVSLVRRRAWRERSVGERTHLAA